MVKLIGGTTEDITIPSTSAIFSPLWVKRLLSRIPYSSEVMVRLVEMRQ